MFPIRRNPFTVIVHRVEHYPRSSINSSSGVSPLEKGRLEDIISSMRSFCQRLINFLFQDVQ